MKTVRRLSIAAAIAATSLLAQNAVQMPVAKQQLLDNNGKPAAGSCLYSFYAGTSTPLATYSDSGAGSPNTNPVALDSAGRANVWLGAASYKLVLTSKPVSGACPSSPGGTTYWTVDNVQDWGLLIKKGVMALDSATVTGDASFGGNVTIDATVSAKNIPLSVTAGVPPYIPAKGDGVADDTVAIQKAIDVAHAANGGEIYFPCGTYKTTAPIRTYWGVRLKGQAQFCVTIEKTTNTADTLGSILFSGGVSDNFNVDSILSVVHDSGADTQYASIEELWLQGPTSTPNAYGIYAPRVGRFYWRNVSIDHAAVSVYTRTLWAATLEYVESRFATTGFSHIGDGVNSAGASVRFVGTSCNQATSACYSMSGVVDLTMDTVGADFVTGTAFQFTLCNGTINSPDAEYITGQLFYLDNAKFTVNGMRNYSLTGQNGVAAIRVFDGGTLTLNDSNFAAFTSANGAYNLSIADGATVTSHNTTLPSGGNAYMGLTGGAKLIESNATVGYRVTTAHSVGMVMDGHTVLYAAAAPTAGTFAAGDIAYNTAPTAGSTAGWICTVGGSPGTWKPFSVVDLLAGANTWSAVQTFAAGAIFQAPITNADGRFLTPNGTLNAIVLSNTAVTLVLPVSFNSEAVFLGAITDGVSGRSGVSSTTCTRWDKGLCTAP